MSGQKSIEDVALEFIAVYKRYKDRRYRAPKVGRGDGERNLLRRNPREKARLDKHPC